MDVLHERCAGLDISKKDAKVCVRTPSTKRRGSFTTETTTWGSTTNAVLDLREHLLAARVTLVVIEATSDYWKPFYYVLTEGLNVILVNARQVKNLPGRKTDVSDAAWLAQLGAHGLVRPSFVPPEPVRELRDLTRARTTATRERGRVVQRLEKLLEDTGIKLSAVASDIMGVSGRAMLEALVCGEADPQVLADLAKRKLRNKIPELTEALTGRFREHHAFLTRLHLDQYDHLTTMIDQLTGRIEEAMAPFRDALDLLDTIPGINQATAEVIIAETGGDMTRFTSAKHLASWAGVCPGHHESAGRTKNTKVRPGNPYLKGALGLAAFGAVRTKDTYLQARYKRLTARRGPLRALVAVEHSIITAIWHMLTDNVA
ncbi:IS110 family transposase, partial [Streptomyces atratus]|uniref:IS110 family transposase n=1 Tax=Streptomyces atratus TaxID=1893 RepID=UPI00340CA730